MNNLSRTKVRTAVENTTNKLLKANNTVTTLEIKVELRKMYPNTRYNQDLISDTMKQLSQENKYTYIDNGTYRIYSLINQPSSTRVKRGLVKGSAIALAAGAKAALTRLKNKTVHLTVAQPISNFVKSKTLSNKISRQKALDMIKDNKGHFFTAVFVKKDGTDRKINAQYLKDQQDMSLGYIKVREASKLKSTPNDCTRNVNLQTLKSLKIKGNEYTIKK